MKDYYSILGVTPTAPKEVIVAAYTALALKLDPLKHEPAEVDGEVTFSDIAEALSTLSSETRRAQYDNALTSHRQAQVLNSNDGGKQKEEDFNRAWSISRQFHTSEDIQQDYLRLLNISPELARRFQQLILDEKLVSSPVGLSDQIIDEYLQNSFGKLSKWMRILVNTLYAKKMNAAIDELRLSIQLMKGSVDEIDIIKTICNKYNIKEVFLEIKRQQAEDFKEKEMAQQMALEVAQNIERNKKDILEKRKSIEREEKYRKMQAEHVLKEKLRANDARMGWLIFFALLLLAAFFLIKSNKAAYNSEIVVQSPRTPEKVKIGDDNRLYVSGYLDSDAVTEIKESMQGGVLAIEMESINGDVESLLNFSKLVEIYKKPIVVRGACPLQCAVVAFASGNVIYQVESKNQGDLKRTMLMSNVERAEMLKRLATLGATESEIKAAGSANYDMSSSLHYQGTVVENKAEKVPNHLGKIVGNSTIVQPAVPPSVSPLNWVQVHPFPLTCRVKGGNETEHTLLLFEPTFTISFENGRLIFDFLKLPQLSATFNGLNGNLAFFTTPDSTLVKLNRLTSGVGVEIQLEQYARTGKRMSSGFCT